MKNCPNQKKNLANCNCSYEPCSRKGLCCECIAYHRKNRQLPACFFSPDDEKTYDRSIEKFVSIFPMRDSNYCPASEKGRAE